MSGPQAGWFLVRVQVVYAASFAALACVSPWLSWALTGRGWTPSSIGAAGAVLTVAAVAAAPAWGAFEDCAPGWGLSSALLVTGLAAAGLATVIPSGTLLPVFVAVAVFGLASGALEGLATGAAFRWLGPEAPVGLLRRAGSAAWIVGLLTAAAVAAVAGRAVFAVGAAMCLLAVPWVPRPPLAASVRTATTGLPLGRVTRLLAHTLPVPVGLFIVLIFAGGFVRAEGRSPWSLALPLALMAVLEIPALAAASRLSARWTPFQLLSAAFVLLGGGFALLAAAPGIPALAAAQPLLAGAFSLWYVGQTQALATISAGRHALGQSLAAVATKGVAGTLAGVAGGTLATRAGYPLLFLAEALLAAVGLAAWVARPPPGTRRPERPAPRNDPAHCY